LPDAFLIGREFIREQPVCLILGDNILYATGLTQMMEDGAELQSGAQIFAYYVPDPERHGVVEFDDEFRAIKIEEKPRTPRSNYAVPGIYFYDGTVSERARSLQPSGRGELEITDLNMQYLAEGQLAVRIFGRGTAWLDAGTQESLLEASEFVKTLEKRQGLKIGCPEEIAFRKAFIPLSQLRELVERLRPSEYRVYLERLVREEDRGTGPLHA
jgi:glucose-1-phosphate thymidylyltransferase